MNIVKYTELTTLSYLLISAPVFALLAALFGVTTFELNAIFLLILMDLTAKAVPYFILYLGTKVPQNQYSTLFFYTFLIVTSVEMTLIYFTLFIHDFIDATSGPLSSLILISPYVLLIPLSAAICSLVVVAVKLVQNKF
ncbi:MULTISPECIES: hypothetical protein [Pseudoalteromonas]|uniref:Uncharacterized protein n=1 Tax=Pseudoalteromonas amylolytica TaxID=1859457 RepID=A0A1S1MPC5_9GAMM|nr:MULTISPECIES: hypothetical protein [Pseudoalteromonas]OHU84393.1 hypothetical protein BFC16_01775 [Pseudoalteromonas sp. JW3]OHU87067.1 hypothetical protein BET10_00160 [Pseudoalteromonas amylolytica]